MSLDAIEVVELDSPVDVDVPVGGGPGHVVTLPGHPRNLVAQRRRARVQRRASAPPSGEMGRFNQEYDRKRIYFSTKYT